MPVATLAWPTLEQQICLDAVAIDGRLAVKRLVTTRAGGVAGALATQTLHDVPHLLSRIFPLCGMAHAVAGLTAIETALQIELPPAQRAFRELVLLAEHAAALGWRILMDWPPLLGASPQMRACADIRRAAAAIATFTTPAPWTRIGGVELRLDRDGLGRTVSELAHMLIELFPEAGDLTMSWRELETAMQGSASMPARLIRAARHGEMADYGRHGRPPLSSMDADWFAARLASESDFADAPTLDGVPAEVGALAARRHPLIAEAVAHWGPTLATRLLAAALDAPVVAGRLYRALDRLADDDAAEVDLLRSGRGAGVAETARGPLAYYVETAGGRAQTLRSVAPTEWNFHPAGPFMTALADAPKVDDPIFAARLLAASFDPCVPFTIGLPRDERQPASPEHALHA
jgi:coenzyme F420-reducing hydrogenase alpha subunit